MKALAGHFFRALFDFGFLTQRGADSFARMFLGALGGLLGAGLIVTRVFVGRYQVVAGAATPARYRVLFAGDDVLFLAVPMLLAALTTLLVSDLMFPSQRDFRILGPLPVSRRTVFGAKIGAVAAFNVLIIVVLQIAVLPANLVMRASRWNDAGFARAVGSWLVASSAGAVFAIAAVMAVVGLLVVALPQAKLAAAVSLMRSALLAALLACAPLVLHFTGLSGAVLDHSPLLAMAPPMWFAGLERVLLHGGDSWFDGLARQAVVAIVVAGAIVLAAYAWLYRHLERMMLRSGGAATRWPPGAVSSPTRASAVERAVGEFTLLTLWRSPLHQTPVLALLGLGVAVAVDRLWFVTPSTFARLAFVAPFLTMLISVVGVRISFALPIEHRAAWMFRTIVDDATRRDQLRAVERIAAWIVVAPAVAIAGAGLLPTAGPRAVGGIVAVGLIGLILVDRVLADATRIPFTSSYLPGKRFIVQTFALSCLTWAYFPLLGGGLTFLTVRGGVPAPIVLIVLLLIVYRLRRRRIAAWTAAPLTFEDELPDQILELGLH